MIRPTLKLLRYLAPIAQGAAAVAPLVVWTWQELSKSLSHVPLMLETMKSLRDDPWRPMNLYFVTSDGKRYQVLEDKGVRLPRFGRASKPD